MSIKKIIICISVILCSSATAASAASTVKKMTCMDFSETNTPVIQQKKELLLEVKRAAANQIFGELISSSTSVTDLELTNDVVTSSSVGMIRIQGNPEYSTKGAFGETCVSITAYATKEDQNKFKPVPISNKQCISDANLTVRAIRKHAETQVVLTELDNYERKLSVLDAERRLALVHKIKYVESGFIPESATYCAKFKGVVFPIEIITALASIPNEPVTPQPNAHIVSSNQSAGVERGNVIPPSNYSILNRTPYATDADLWVNAKECGIDVRFPKWIYAYSRKTAHPVQSLNNEENLLNLTFTEVQEYDGLLHLTVTGELYKTGLKIGNFKATKSGSRPMFKTRCRTYANFAKNMAKDIATWARKPSMNSTID